MDHTQSTSARAILYSILSRLFTYPLDAEVLNVVAGLVLESPTLVPSNIETGLVEIQSSVEGAGDSSVLLETLHREATRLFEGPGQPAAPPFGSFYLNNRQLMGPEASAVRKAYLGAEMLPEQNKHLPPDHIALELGFMSALAQADTKAARDTAREFLNNHLLTWVPRWRHDVLAAKPHTFYRGLVNLTLASLEADQHWLGEIQHEIAPESSGALERKL